MPKKVIDYRKTIIYKIVCNDLNVKDCYVGSTTDFNERKYKHKSNCNNEQSNKYGYNVYKFIRENGNWCNWSMIEIEKYKAVDKLDALKRERYWIEQLNASLNNNIPSRTEAEYHIDYKRKHYDKIIDYQKEYRKENKDKLNEYKKKQVECECGMLFNQSNKARHMKSKKHIAYLSKLIV
jgi:hypothetical protein